MNPSSHRKRCTNATLRCERLEDRRVLAGVGGELPIAPLIAPDGEHLSDLASQVVEQVQSHAAARLGQSTTAAPKAFPDVDGKDGVTSFDALLVINDLNRYGTRLLEAHETAGWSVDVDKDGWVTPYDALTVVNTVNYQLRQRSPSAAATQVSETVGAQTFASLQPQNVDPTVQPQNDSIDLITKVYPVGDLVIPVHQRHAGLLGGLGGGFVGGLLNGFADGLRGGFGGGGLRLGGMDAGGTHNGEYDGGGYDGGGMWGGGMNGDSNADFDTLIDLITTTIAPDSWEQRGGDGTIQANPQNLSLVVGQTQAVHEQIADLLDQLRRIQDLQVTIEVRFITLDDNFFERIGVDFDFDLDDQTLPLPGEQDFADGAPGVNEVVSFRQSFDRRDIPSLNFNQDSFVIAPPFGGGQIDAGGSLGFAILSDIEVFFLLQASQGDNQSEVVEAPKVTLFNGQTAAIVSDNQLPFVTSVSPAVG